MKRFIKIAGIAFIPIYIFVFLFFIFPKSSNDPSDNVTTVTEIAELWHVDIFEGGSGSRGEFLKSRAMEYQQKSDNKFILVKVLTYEQMLSNLSEGYYPDLFSFGTGLSSDILSEICAFSGSIAVYDNLLISGVLEEKVFAVPWCAGSYMVAGVTEHLTENDKAFKEILTTSAKQTDKSTLYSFVTGFSMFNNPMLAAFLANSELKFAENSYNAAALYTQVEAYTKFVSKNASVFLLGTQRDAVRLNGRDNSSDFSMQPLQGFTDLVCYIGISKRTNSLNLCNGFIEYLLCDSSQQKLTQLNMFSVNNNSLYDQGIMQEMEENLQNCSVINTFTSKEILAENRTVALQALTGDEDSAKKIWEMFPNDLNK